MNKNDPSLARDAKVGGLVIGALLLFGVIAGVGSGGNSKPVEPAQHNTTQTAPAAVHAKGSMVVSTSDGNAPACEILDQRALAVGAPGRIFDLNDPDKCSVLFNGTAVVPQKYFKNAACVAISEEAWAAMWTIKPPPQPSCLWVLASDLYTY
jgi:hypothetical protein